MPHQSRHVPRRPRSKVRARFPRNTTPPAVTAPKSLRIPITNVYGGGDYTAQILVGSQKRPANVIIDTGSSTLAVTLKAYAPAQDTELKATTLAQVVLYGTGGWAGPVVETGITLAGVGLPSAPLAITEAQEPNNFGAADGILGLAYNVLNSAFDLTGYLRKKDVNPPNTYPWRLKVQNAQAAVEAFGQELASQPQSDVDPYFTALEEQSIVANKLAFYTLRSFPRVATAGASNATLAKDKLNQGFLILGGGEEQTDLFTGTFADVIVVDDIYYNVNLKSVRVGSGPVIAAAPLQANFVSEVGSNAIVDSGTNVLVLAADVYAAVEKGLNALNPNFVKQIDTANQSNDGIAATDLALASWPDIAFTLQGATGDVTLTVTPATYWQIDAPAPGRAISVLSPGGAASASNPAQSILGLPLMNNYYTVFDRSVDAKGIIRFAPIKS
jgi:hypothetical protein